MPSRPPDAASAQEPGRPPDSAASAAHEPARSPDSAASTAHEPVRSPDSAASAAHESVSDASDPYQRERQTFPTLDDEQIERAKGYGSVERMAAGTVLFERGERTVDFFLVLRGNVEIFDLDERGEVNVFTVHGEHQFTGELDLFNSRKILVGGRTGEDSEILRVPRNRFQKMVSAETDLGETIMRAFILRRTAFLMHDQAGVIVFGEPNGAGVLRVRRFLSRNGYPYRFVDSTAENARDALPAGCEVDTERLPAVVRPKEGVLHDPSTPALADALGLTEPLDEGHVHDLAVIGAGPSGLSAAVYAASESLDTVVVEQEAPGGQAGTSSRIENYLGFPTGISGQALAGRAWIQSQKFGARFVVARSAIRIGCDGQPFRIALDDDAALLARAIVVATGATYRTLDLEDYERYEGQGIHYAATAIEAQLCTGEEIVVVGGGNSAGQAAVFLSRHASHVHVLVRGDSLADSMSDYLVRRIDSSSRITLHTHAEISALHGERLLERVSWREGEEESTHDIANVFVMIGAVPNTGWLEGCVELDERGFVRTGLEVEGGRPSSPFTTSVEGIYAVGDVRSGSVKRVASGVGEGSVCIQSVHRWMSTLAEEPSEAVAEEAAATEAAATA